ncbi:phage holin family protein [Variovorax sp. dw_954]|uniref:phage holin family protein n=1 Tax=Variovorax sp. dw_954 TaxID=2720078 RepID=UPI001BD55B44|nr:phage holin family protein [Variovorax sp. dw_954]
MKLLSLFGLNARIRRLRIAAGEGALAAEDRVQLVRMTWEAEKQRYKLMLVLVIAVLGLTTVAVALLSVAVVVHFWDTPNRIAAAWSVAALWIVLWVIAVVKLVKAMTDAKTVVADTRREFERDWQWARHRFGLDSHDDEEQPERSATLEELMARIEHQRLRIMTLEAPDPEPAPGTPPPDESAGAAALRIAREHPVAVGVAAAAVVAVLGPRRLIRWTGVIAPVIWRMR